MLTGDIGLIKDINERLVLNLIREHELISGAELANITGMRPSTISSLLKELQSKSLVINRGKGESTIKGGKRPFLWSLNKDVGYVVGLDLEINQAIGVVLDLESNVIQRTVYQDRQIKKSADLVKLTREVTEDLTVKRKIPLESILGMGIGISGIVNADKGIIITTDVLKQEDIPLREMLKECFDFPVFVENNANAAAMGAKWVEKSGNVDNFMTVVVEVGKHVGGLGIGLILNGGLFHGAKFASGELNFMLPTLSSELQSLKDRFKEGEILSKQQDNLDAIDIHFIIEAAREGDKIAIEYFQRLGQTIGEGIASSVALINPEKLIIEGDIAVLDEIITEPIIGAIKKEVHTFTSSSLEIETGAYGRYAVSIGAASIILNDIFKIPLVTSNAIKTYF